MFKFQFYCGVRQLELLKTIHHMRFESSMVVRIWFVYFQA